MGWREDGVGWWERTGWVDDRESMRWVGWRGRGGLVIERGWGGLVREDGMGWWERMGWFGGVALGFLHPRIFFL